AEIGITPARLVSPTVGLIATIPLIAAGLTRDPLVSVPSAMAVRLADTATAEPLLDPDGDRSSAYGLRVCPPRPLQPFDAWNPRKFAHSVRFVFPRITAPASRSFATTVASCAGVDAINASDPAMVYMPSAVSMLSF